MRKLALTLAVIMTAAVLMQPVQGQAASQLDKVNQQIKDLQNEINRKANEKKNAERTVKTLAVQKDATKEEIAKLLKEIDQAGVKLAEAEDQVAQTEAQLAQTQQERDDAIAQENLASKSLDSRIRLMYMEGKVPYLDVVLNAANFNDFLSSFDDMQYITTQTRSLLDSMKEARELVELKEAEVTKELLEVQLLKDSIADQKADLEGKERDKEAMMAKLNQEIDDMEEISEEAEKELMALASKMSKAEAERNRLKTYYTGGKLRVPLDVSYRITSDFGTRIHPITHKKQEHSGIDMAVPKGTPIYAAESGVVIIAQWWSSYGNCVIIDHGGGLWTVYGHIMDGGILVKKGQTVKRGDQIAKVGMTGQATGYHLHFEVRKNEKPVDPKPYLK